MSATRETGDDAGLDAAFERYTMLLDRLMMGVQSIPMKAGESFEAYLERVLKNGNEPLSGSQTH